MTNKSSVGDVVVPNDDRRVDEVAAEVLAMLGDMGLEKNYVKVALTLNPTTAIDWERPVTPSNCLTPERSHLVSSLLIGFRRASDTVNAT